MRQSGYFLEKRVIRAGVTFLLLAFLFFNISFAGDLSINDISIPEKIGSIKKRYKGKNGKLVIHIQDAHCNYEVQTNISKMLENLSKTHNINIVSVEGADGFIDISYFKALQDVEMLKKFANSSLKKGELTGAEFLAITKDYPIKLYGVENQELYDENLNVFTSTYPRAEEIEKYLLNVKTILSKLKRHVYSKDLKRFDEAIEKFRKREMSLSEYAKILNREREKQKIELIDYPSFTKIMYHLKHEGEVNLNEVNNANLFRELELMRNSVNNRLFRSSNDRSLSVCWDNINILLNLVAIRLSQEEFNYYKKYKDVFEVEFIADLIRSMAEEYNLAYSMEDPPESIGESLAEFERFYEIATKRDSVLTKNTIEIMDREEQDVAVLIAGGFHTKGIIRTLEESGVSYVVMSPAITRNDESPYIKVLKGLKTHHADAI